MKRSYRRPVAVCSLLVLTGLFTLAVLHHDAVLERRFERINIGMTEQQVLAVLGRPDADEPCGKLGGFPQNCLHELRYEPKIPTITSYVVFIDGHGVVADKYVYQSP